MEEVISSGGARDKQKIIGLEVLKILALCGAVALHTQRSLELGELWNPYIYYLSRFCMPVFFMVNGALIMSKNSFSFEYYKKKVLNVIRILATWSVISVLYSYFLLHADLKESLFSGVKTGLGAYIVPFWFLFTFVIIYTILLFSFDWIKQHLSKIVLCLVLVCVAVDVASMINISGGGYFIQSYVNGKFRIWTWMMYFLLGYFLSQYDNINTRVVIILLLLSTVSAWLLQYYLCWVYLGRMNSSCLYDNFVIIVWTSCLFQTLYRLDIKSEKLRKAILLISSNMFGVFLLHGYIINHFHLTEKVQNGGESMILYLIVVITCWIATYILCKVPVFRKVLKY